MHGLAQDAVLALELAGKKSMLHASLAPPPQARQRGRRISKYDVLIQLGTAYLPSLYARRDLRWCLQSFSGEVCFPKDGQNPNPLCGARVVVVAAFLTCWWVQPMPISQPKGWKRWWIWWTKQVKDSGRQVIVTCNETLFSAVSVVSFTILNFDLSEQSCLSIR